jgi:hypothetical protein
MKQRYSFWRLLQGWLKSDGLDSGLEMDPNHVDSNAMAAFGGSEASGFRRTCSSWECNAKTDSQLLIRGAI